MADSENWDGRAWGTSTSRKFSEVIDNRPLRIRTVGGVEGAEDQKSSPLSDLNGFPAHSPSMWYTWVGSSGADEVSQSQVIQDDPVDKFLNSLSHRGE